MAPYKLRVTVAGLWLFVRDQNAIRAISRGHEKHVTHLLYGKEPLTAKELNKVDFELLSEGLDDESPLPSLPDLPSSVFDLRDLSQEPGLKCPRENTNSSSDLVTATVSLRPCFVTGLGVTTFKVGGKQRIVSEAVDFWLVRDDNKITIDGATITLPHDDKRMRIGLINAKDDYDPPTTWHGLETPEKNPGPGHFHVLYDLALPALPHHKRVEPEPEREAEPITIGDPVCIGATVPLAEPLVAAGVKPPVIEAIIAGLG